MSSTFSAFSGQKVKGFAGKEYSVPIYLQFVPGYCVDVIHSRESTGYVGPSSVNTIYAVSHVSNPIGKRRQQFYSEDNRYFPLLRNHGDVPTKGDPVLLCTIGKINYYLGPINTINNSPTWNDDLSYKKELTIRSSDTTENTPRGERGESLNFNKEALYSRLQKRRNKDLDYGNIVNEVTGDYLIEGRHGNSVRVGSRSNHPYVFISNQRDNMNIFETLGDGSLITITSKGTLANHFPGYYDVNTKQNIKGFKLSSDLVETNTKPIGQLYSDTNNKIDQQEIYRYGSEKTDEVDDEGNPIFKPSKGNQVLINSDRIIFNSKLDDIFVSSIKDIYIGAGVNLSLTSPTLNLVSNNVNIGSPNKEGVVMESMVLGDKLLEILSELFTELKAATSLFYGSPLPLMDQTGGTPLTAKLSPIENKLKDLLSKKHKIEQG